MLNFAGRCPLLREFKQDAVFKGSDCIDSYFDALSALWLLSDYSLIALWKLTECSEGSLIALWPRMMKISISWAPVGAKNIDLECFWFDIKYFQRSSTRHRYKSPSFFFSSFNWEDKDICLSKWWNSLLKLFDKDFPEDDFKMFS